MKYIFDDFNIEDGSNKFILSAPHCSPQLRNGIVKKREIKTGFLVKSLAKKFDCPCVYKTKFYNNDPNWDENSPYKEHLVDFILKNDVKLLLDIHSMNAERDVDVCIGVNSGINIFNRFDMANLIKNSFIEFGFKNVFIDNPFNASSPSVISAYVSDRCKIPCFQIELNNRFLFAGYDTYNYDLVEKVFINIIEQIKDLL